MSSITARGAMVLSMVGALMNIPRASTRSSCSVSTRRSLPVHGRWEIVTGCCVVDDRVIAERDDILRMALGDR